MQSLGLQQPAPKTAAREQSGTAERPSFRSSMERAEQQAAKPAKEPDAAQEPAEPQLEEGLNEAAEEAALEGATLEPAAPEAEEGAMEGLLALLMGGVEEKPEEDAPAQSELQIGELAAAMMQQAGVQPQPQVMTEEQGVIQAVVQEGQAQDQNMAWQAAVPQEGEQQEAPRMEAAAQAVHTNFENTFAEAARPVDMKAREQDTQPQEQNMQELPGQLAQAFGAGRQQAASVADLTAPNGGTLPAPEMGQALQDSLFDQIQTAVSTGKQELFIQLKPETLGGLVIQLSMTEEGIKAQVRTGSENIQSMVNAQIAQLEEALRARDVPIVQMEVIYDQSASNNFLNQQRHAWQEQSGGGSQRALTVAIEDTAGLYEAALAPDDIAEGLGEGVEYSA